MRDLGGTNPEAKGSILEELQTMRKERVVVRESKDNRRLWSLTDTAAPTLASQPAPAAPANATWDAQAREAQTAAPAATQPGVVPRPQPAAREKPRTFARHADAALRSPRGRLGGEDRPEGPVGREGRDPPVVQAASNLPQPGRGHAGLPGPPGSMSSDMREYADGRGPDPARRGAGSASPATPVVQAPADDRCAADLPPADQAAAGSRRRPRPSPGKPPARPRRECSRPRPASTAPSPRSRR